MRLHTLSPAPGSRRPRKRVGRGPGSGHGQTSGRGDKGQKARSGPRLRPWFEGGQMPLTRRLPKRGFTNVFRKTYALVNLRTLEQRFEAGSAVTPQVLLERGLIAALRDGVKVLGEGSLTKALTVQAHRFSRSAGEKIAAAGGTAVVIGA
ncbi:MAG TPA: 50S ribosomal protein L15 [Candidatus Methylomirabilis sp.]|nr:50S ribosomal protein L15 [Candidatus Methylomirabilis sp.]